MKYDMEDGYWWGLIHNGRLKAVVFSKRTPDMFDFNVSFTISSENYYEIIPVNIREVE